MAIKVVSVEQHERQKKEMLAEIRKSFKEFFRELDAIKDPIERNRQAREAAVMVRGVIARVERQARMQGKA